MAVVALGGAAGAAIPLFGPGPTLVGFGTVVLISAVALHPPLAAYLLIGVTPLVAGIDRDAIVPVVRPNEALAVIVAAGLAARGVARLRVGHLPSIKIGPIDRSIIVMALAASVLPLAWMLVRGLSVSQDDLLYALMIWKYYGVYLIVRCSVRSERQLRACLIVAMAAGAIVAAIAVIESLELFGITRLLSRLYTPYGNVQALQDNRGGSTLSLPVAVADLMTLNLAIVVGFLIRSRSARSLLWAIGVLFVVGALASGQFSAGIALVLGAVTMAVVARRIRPLAAFVPAVILAGYALRPVIERRLSGFQSPSGLPVSWTGRLHNLTTYFWPDLFSRWNFLLGVRPAARVATAKMSTGYIWIESGYTWLLWSGGIPLLAAFVYFLLANIRRSARIARTRLDAVGVTALAVVVGLVVVGVLMVIDPHLTYRGSADLLFSLLGLMAAGVATPSNGVQTETQPEPLVKPKPDQPAAAELTETPPSEESPARVELSTLPMGWPSPAQRGGRRILIVIENVPLSHDHRAGKQVESLLRAGYGVSVISPRHPDNAPWRHTDGLRLLEYRAPKQGSGKLSYVSEYSYSWLAASRLATRAFREEGFKAIQAGHPPDIYFALALPFKLAGCRFVVDQRDLSPELYRARYGDAVRGPIPLLERLERLSWRSADRVLCVNESLRRTILKRGEVPPERVTVIGNGPVLARTFRRQPRPELKEGRRFLACWVGMMGRQDRVDLSLRAIQHLVHMLDRRDCHFAFIGEGEALRDLNRLAGELGIRDSVRFTGWLDQERCFEYLSTANIGLDSSLQEEVSPVKVLEYMAFGLPFAAFDLREVRAIAEGAAAFAPPGDAQALALTIDALLEDPIRRREMSLVGVRRVEESLAWDRQEEAYVQVYDQLLNTSSSARIRPSGEVASWRPSP